MWLTDIWGQNDPSELKHSFCHAVKILNRHAAEGSAELKKFAQGFESLLTGNRVHDAGRFFISCLSVAGDDLGQWRAYAEDGRGYALAFDTSLLEDAFRQASKPHDQTFRITYSDRKAVRLQTQIIDELLPLVSAFPSEGDLLIHAWLHCLITALFFKHAAYRNEAEYRFLEIHQFDSAQECKRREFAWRSHAALKKIIIGPAADRTKAVRFAEKCLRAYHCDPPVEVVCSPIPYRPRLRRA